MSQPLHRSAINFAWLIRLRTGAIVGQLATVLFARFVLDLDVPLVPALAIISAEAATNVGAVIARRRSAPKQTWSLGVMAFDMLALTALLYFTGGPYNPFSFLYLVHIALAAVILDPSATWALVALALAASASLFVAHRPMAVGTTHAEHMSFHLRGMWVAFFVAATFIVYFLLRVTRALADREEELMRTRALAARREKLASLATLSAGAAHELSTPLSTIAVVTKELERRLARSQTNAPELVEDVALIRAEVDRCRGILAQMAADAGDSHGEQLVSRSISELLRASIAGLPPSPAIELTVPTTLDSQPLSVPERAVAIALRGVIKNAQDASRDDSPIEVRATAEADRVRITIADHGSGMSAETLARAGEPFFTTKEPGRGMGLGLFLSRAVVEQLGGSLAMSSTPGSGTLITVELPRT